MMHLTETGPYRGLIKNVARHRSSISQSITNNLNKPLPWVCVFALIVMWLIWMVAELKADYRVEVTRLAAEVTVANSRAEAANQRISDKINADAQIQSAIEQSMNDTRNRAIDSEVQAMLLREHYDKIANDFAAKGYLLPSLPKTLKTAK